MNKEELVAEAIKRYPPGTRFISCMDSEDVIVGNHHYTPENGKDRIAVDGKGCTGRLIYLDGGWADIVSVPIVEQVNEYILI